MQGQDKDQPIYLLNAFSRVCLTSLVRSESGGYMHVCIVVGILLIAHCGICNFLVAHMQVLLLVDHVPSPGAV